MIDQATRQPRPRRRPVANGQRNEPVSHMNEPDIAPRSPPGPKGRELTATIRRLREDPLGERIHLHERYGDSVELRFGPFSTLLLSHPAHVKHVLQDRARNYDKQTVAMDIARSYAPDGLITSEGDQWALMRKRSQPAFHRRMLDRFVQIAASECDHLIAEWTARCQEETIIDVQPDLYQLTLNVIGKALFGSARFQGSGERFLAAFNQVLGEAPRSSVDRWGAADGAAARESPAFQAFWASVKTLDDIGIGIIRERRKAPPADDLLWLLMNTASDGQAAYSERDLCNQLKNLALAGHETSANGLGFCLHLLAGNPAIQAAAVESLPGPLTGDQELRFEAVQALGYCEAAFREALRLYPPVWLMERRAREADVVGHWAIRKHAMVTLCQWLTHRDARFWPEPEAFRPDRFLDGNRPAQPYAFFGFGGGQRTCIGMNMALSEGALCLARLLRAFEFSPVPGFELTLKPRIALRPANGLRLRVRGRPDASGQGESRV